MARKIRIRKRKKINWGLWVTLGLVFLMVTSTLGFLTGQGDGSSLTYNNHKFIQTAQGYMVTIDDNKLVFQYSPETVDYYEVPATLIHTLLGAKALLITYDPQDEQKETLALMQYNMVKILREVKNIYAAPGLVNNTGYSVAQTTCTDATAENPVIYLQSGNTTGFTQDGDCMILTGGTSAELAQLHDRLLYGVLGVIA